MSLGWSKESSIYCNIPYGVQRQLDARKATVTKTTRDNDDLLFLNSNTGWVKLSSGVEFSPSSSVDFAESDKASNNILFNGITDKDGNNRQGFSQNPQSSYELSEKFGYRPMAGITNAAIKTQGTFGAVKKATVEFQLNSLTQLEKFERLYLLPGFSMLLEWGHSIALQEDGKLETNIRTYPNFFENLEPNNVKKQKQRTVAILDKLDEIRINSSYNYDAMLGKVSNFIWSFNQEGTYACSIDITGHGEVTESLSALFSGKINDVEKSLNINNSKLYENLKLLQDYKPSCTGLPYDFKSNESDSEIKTQILKEFSNAFVVPLQSLDESIADSAITHKYIALGSLLNFINIHYQLKDKGVPIVQFYTGNHNTVVDESEYKNISPFITFNNHISYNPNVCILPKKTDSEAALKYKFASSELVEKCIKGGTDDILNILVNVNWVKSLVSNVLESNKEEDISLYDVLNTLLSDISESLGNINSFDFYEEKQMYYVIDRKTIPSGKQVDFTFDLFGLKGLATGIKLESLIPSSLSATIAVAASAGGSSYTTEIFNFQSKYANYFDRIVPQRSQDDETEDKEQKGQEEFNKLTNNIGILTDYLYTINEKYTIPTTSRVEIKTAHQAITNLLLKEELVEKNQNPPGVLPIQLSFDMLGVSGIRITDVFNVAEGLLPSSYKDTVSFTITAIDNKIQDNRWTTSFSALMMITEPMGVKGTRNQSIRDIIQRSAEYSAVNQDDDSLFPNATELRDEIKKSPYFSEKVSSSGRQLTNSGRDIEPETAAGGILLMNKIEAALNSIPATFDPFTRNSSALKFRFTAGNDRFHIFNPKPPETTLHKYGRALDLAIQQDYTVAQLELATEIVTKAQEGVCKSFKDEYKEATGHATGGHWHFQF